MIGLLARRETFFIWSWVCDLIVEGPGVGTAGGELGGLEVSFLDLTVDMDVPGAAGCCCGEFDAFALGSVAALAKVPGGGLAC